MAVLTDRLSISCIPKIVLPVPELASTTPR